MRGWISYLYHHTEKCDVLYCFRGLTIHLNTGIKPLKSQHRIDQSQISYHQNSRLKKKPHTLLSHICWNWTIHAIYSKVWIYFFCVFPSFPCVRALLSCSVSKWMWGLTWFLSQRKSVVGPFLHIFPSHTHTQTHRHTHTQKETHFPVKPNEAFF